VIHVSSNAFFCGKLPPQLQTIKSRFKSDSGKIYFLKIFFDSNHNNATQCFSAAILLIKNRISQQIRQH